MNLLFLLAQAVPADNAGAGAAGVFFGFGAIFLILAIVLSLFWLWMLFDALTNSSLDTPMKIVWALVIFFTHIIGALAYFFLGRKTVSA